MKRDEVISRISQTAKPFTVLFERLVEEEKMELEFNSQWKLKDVLGHILWYEEEMADMIAKESIKDSSQIWDNELDDRNRLVFEKMKGIESDELLERHKSVVGTICDNLKGLSDEHMTDPGLFEGMPDKWIPWQIIGGSTFFHYTDHLRRLEEFLGDIIPKEN